MKPLDHDVQNLESEDKSSEALEKAVMGPRQVLGAHNCHAKPRLAHIGIPIGPESEIH
jgi:hypothetical protein